MEQKAMPSESGREILRVMAKTIPQMADFKKGYLLGYGEALLDSERARQKQQEKDKPAFAEER